MKYIPVTGRFLKTYAEADIELMVAKDIRLVPELAQYRVGYTADMKRDLLGTTFVFEQLACGDLGKCLGIVPGAIKEPATRRICISHSYIEEEDK